MRSIAFLVLILFSCSMSTRADFDVTVGDIFTYEVVSSQWSLAQSANSGQGTGLQYGGNPFPIGTQFTIEVLTTTATSVQWEIDIEGNTATNTNDDTDTTPFILYLYYPITILQSGFGTWDQSEVEMGPFFQLGLFFLEPIAFSDLFQQLHDQASTGSFTPSSYWDFHEINANYDTSGSVSVFDWVFNSEYNDTGCNIYFSGEYYFTIAFDKATGVLKGYHMDLRYAGHINEQPLAIDMQQLIEIRGYDIEKFYFKAPGFVWLTVFPPLLVISYFKFITRKQRK